MRDCVFCSYPLPAGEKTNFRSHVLAPASHIYTAPASRPGGHRWLPGREATVPAIKKSRRARIKSIAFLLRVYKIALFVAISILGRAPLHTSHKTKIVELAFRHSKMGVRVARPPASDPSPLCPSDPGIFEWRNTNSTRTPRAPCTPRRTIRPARPGRPAGSARPARPVQPARRVRFVHTSRLRPHAPHRNRAAPQQYAWQALQF